MAATEIWDYYQQILLAQYSVSDKFNNKLVRGEAREDFLKYLIGKSIKKVELLKGCVTSDRDQTGQCDCIVIDSYASRHELGGQTMVDVKACKAVIEIKSRLTLRDLRKAESDALKLKKLSSSVCPRYGVFTYHLRSNKNTILSKFGIFYDEDLDSYQYDMPSNKSEFHELDFVACISIAEVDGIEDRNDFFITKDRVHNSYSPIFGPVMKNLFTIIEEL